jgi:predicted AAA+ superfamily ATPase
MRYVTNLIKESLKDFPAVLLIGARQVGKSTVAKQLVKEGICNEYISFDDISNLQLAVADPDGFLERFTENVALDEVQRVPDLLRAIKKSVDANRRPGRFLLTGSANVLAMPQVSESLSGRVDVVHLEGLSLGEILERSHRPTFIDLLFNEGGGIKSLVTQFMDQRNQLPSISRQLYGDLLYYGGFPEVWSKQNPTFARRWFASYQKTYLERDVRDVSRAIDLIPFGKLLELSAIRTGNLQVLSSMAGDVGIDQRTVSRYLGILELTFQVNHLTPWFSNVSKRLIKSPKIFMNDVGTACFYHQIKSSADLWSYRSLGALSETWVWGELRKQLVFSPGIRSNFYRTHQGKEIDFVLSSGSKLFGIELKWSSSVDSSDFSGLKDLTEAAPPDTQGVVLYLGEDAISFGPNLAALPLRALLI